MLPYLIAGAIGFGIGKLFEEGGEAGEKYVNGGGVGKYKMYKLRAEGLNDFINFLGTGVYFNVKSFTVEPIGVPDVVVSFETNLSLSEIKAKLREVQDSHVMLETIKPIKEYTGERYAGGGEAGKYSIIVWETEEDRDAGESFVAEILTNKQEALEKAEKMYYKQDFSAIEVIDENDEVILHLSSNEEEDEDEYAGGGKITDADLNYYIYPNKIVKIAYLGKIQMGYFFSLKDALKEIEYLTMAYPKNEIEKYAIITPDKTFHLGEKEYNIRFDNGGEADDDLFSMSKTIIENGKITEMVIAENVSVNEFNKLFSDKGYEKRNDETLVGFYFMKPNGDTIQLIPSFHKKGEILKYAGGGGVGSKTLTRKYLQNKGRNVFTFGYGMPKDAIDKYGTIGGTEYFELPNGDVYKKSKEDSDKFVLIGNKSKMVNGGGVDDYIEEQVKQFNTDKYAMRKQYGKENIKDIEYQGFLAIDENNENYERLSDYEFEGEEFDRDNLLEVAKKYPQADYITFHARLMGESDFGIEDELSPIDDLAMEFDMARLNQFANGGEASEKYILRRGTPIRKNIRKKRPKTRNPKMIRTIFEEEYFEDFDNGGEVYALVDKFDENRQDYDQLYFKTENYDEIIGYIADLKNEGEYDSDMQLIEVSLNGKMRKFDSSMLSNGGEAGKTSNLSSVKRKYLKNENENAHSENVVLLAENFGNSEDLKLAKEILKLHNTEGHLSTENGKKRQELHLKLIKIARKKFGQEGIEFAEGGLAKKRRRSASAQYGRSDRSFDKQLTAKPVGYRFSNAKANQLRKDPFAKPTEAQVKKYLGKGIYKENRRNRSDRDRNAKL